MYAKNRTMWILQKLNSIIEKQILVIAVFREQNEDKIQISKSNSHTC